MGLYISAGGVGWGGGCCSQMNRNRAPASNSSRHKISAYLISCVSSLSHQRSGSASADFSCFSETQDARRKPAVIIGTQTSTVSGKRDSQRRDFQRAQRSLSVHWGLKDP